MCQTPHRHRLWRSKKNKEPPAQRPPARAKRLSGVRRWRRARRAVRTSKGRRINGIALIRTNLRGRSSRLGRVRGITRLQDCAHVVHKGVVGGRQHGRLADVDEDGGSDRLELLQRGNVRRRDAPGAPPGSADRFARAHSGWRFAPSRHTDMETMSSEDVARSATDWIQRWCGKNMETTKRRSSGNHSQSPNRCR